MNSISGISETKAGVTAEDLKFHPLIRQELELELSKWLTHLKSVAPENLKATQGKVEILEWVKDRLAGEVLAKERTKKQA